MTPSQRLAKAPGLRGMGDDHSAGPTWDMFSSCAARRCGDSPQAGGNLQAVPMSESIIRDILAGDLSVLENGLELVEVEKYIPSELGTRSFLDLLAKDRRDHWVVVEVKKTNAAAREAAHEILKYADAVQRHFGARNDEIRVFVAAVQWEELLIPFSRLKAESSINVEGFKLELDINERRLKATSVKAIPVSRGRYLAPWHEVNLYKDRAGLDRGIDSYEKSCSAKDIKHYILVVLKTSGDFNERTFYDAQALREVREAFGFSASEDDDNFSVPELDVFQYILYFAPQILSEEMCEGMLAKEADLYNEVMDFTNGMSGDELLCTLHENVYDMQPTPYRDYFEIGYPAKFKFKLLEDEGWVIERIVRKGMFALNALLSDDAIIDELGGSTGSSRQSFRRTINFGNRAQVVSAKADLSHALGNNPGWLAQINRVLDDVSIENANCEGSFFIFNPSSGIFTLYFMATTEDSEKYMPIYEILITPYGSGPSKSYVGLLVPAGQPATFDDILEKYYSGQIINLMLLASAGFYEARDADVLGDLGLIYRTFRIDDPGGNMKWFELKDDRWKAFNPILPFRPLQSYFDTNSGVIKSIVQSIGSRMFRGFWIA